MPSGTLVHVNGGDVSPPAWLCLIGICPSSAHAALASVMIWTAPRPPRPPRPPGAPGCCGGAAPRCCSAAAAMNAAAATARITIVRVDRITLTTLLLFERRRLCLAPDVVAHAERLHGIQVLAFPDDVRAVILGGLRHGDVHRVFAVVVRITVRVGALGHQDVG